MAMDWKVLQKEIDAENTRIIDEAPEDIERVFKYEIIPTGAGTAKTTLGVWFEGATAARYVAAYNTYFRAVWQTAALELLIEETAHEGLQPLLNGFLTINFIKRK